MIDILCEGGTALYGIRMPFLTAKHLLEDGIIPEDGFLEVVFEDGSRGVIKKKSIIGFYETESTQV